MIEADIVDFYDTYTGVMKDYEIARELRYQSLRGPLKPSLVFAGLVARLVTVDSVNG